MTTSPQPSVPAPGRLYRWAWSFYLALAVAGIVWVGLRQGPIPLALFVRPESGWRDLAAGLASAALLLGVWEGCRRVAPAARELEVELKALLGPLRSGEVLALALLSGLAEELFFRGAVQGAWGWLPATLLFAVLHAGPGRSFRWWTAFSALAGALFGGLMVWADSLLAPMTAHFTVNIVNLFRLREAPRPEDGS